MSLGGLVAVAPALAAASVTRQGKPRPPAIESNLVKDFVGAGHGDLDKMKSMLGAHPGLLNASWDWGGGDFESAIGGAGHMGRADIATYLIEQGARYDVFVAAMLGELEVVQQLLARHPNLIKSAGPHGISLVRHAEAGGERAKAVLEFLKAKT